ncbi:MAG: response regulator, partial [Chlorobium sp.]|nr:response regulator [Chlorobium sp.]
MIKKRATIANRSDWRSFHSFRPTGRFNMIDESGYNETHRKSLPQLRVNGEKEQGAIYAPREPMMPTILIVDDDALMLELGGDILKQQGYVVLSASLPSMAIKIAQEHEGTIDLLITDIIMPEMNGQELANKISHISPDTKILLVSGYTGDIILKQ